MKAEEFRRNAVISAINAIGLREQSALTREKTISEREFRQPQIDRIVADTGLTKEQITDRQVLRDPTVQDLMATTEGRRVLSNLNREKIADHIKFRDPDYAQKWANVASTRTATAFNSLQVDTQAVLLQYLPEKAQSEARIAMAQAEEAGIRKGFFAEMTKNRYDTAVEELRKLRTSNDFVDKVMAYKIEEAAHGVAMNRLDLEGTEGKVDNKIQMTVPGTDGQTIEIDGTKLFEQYAATLAAQARLAPAHRRENREAVKLEQKRQQLIDDSLYVLNTPIGKPISKDADNTIANQISSARFFNRNSDDPFVYAEIKNRRGQTTEVRKVPLPFIPPAYAGKLGVSGQMTAKQATLISEKAGVSLEEYLTDLSKMLNPGGGN